MSVPGCNLLNMALTLIAEQTIQYYAFVNRSLNAVGQEISVYAEPITLKGSFQPLSRALYQTFGLDLQRSYYSFYVSKNVMDLERDISPDLIVFNGLVLQCESNNDWYSQDGWKGILVCLSNLAVP